MAWHKTTRQERGYGAEWEKARKLALQRDCGLCQTCRKAGRVRPATEVDHIVSKAAAEQMGWDASRINAVENLQAICSPCHKEKTAQENGKTYKPKPTYGADGWPVDQ